MTEVKKHRWYHFTITEWCVIALILAILAFLLLPAFQHSGNAHVETRTTTHRARLCPKTPGWPGLDRREGPDFARAGPSASLL